ncbi:MAG TPA: nucleotidyltransferase domain-containing protein [Anaerolineae bacterium]|nr:nucleotidyltransferase domain-containing protein [Anaerolineae bacterium]
MDSFNVALERLGIDTEEIAAALSPVVPPYTIFLSGSVVEGYGNSESDLDVFVIYPEEMPPLQAAYTTDTNVILNEYTEHWRLDIECWPKWAVLSTAERISRCAPGNWNECRNLDLNDLYLAHRVRVGIPIEHEEGFRTLHATFDFQHISRVIMTKCLMGYMGIAEDAAGAIDSGQHGAALLMSRQAMQRAIDTLLAAHGDTSPKEKWRFFKLQKLGDANLFERYWVLETQGIQGREDVFEYAKSCLSFANQIVLRSQKMVV